MSSNAERARMALGASRAFPVSSAPAGGPLDLLHQAHQAFLVRDHDRRLLEATKTDLAEGRARVATNGSHGPSERLVFFDEVPQALLERRREAASVDPRLPAWLVLARQPFGPDWTNEVGDRLGILVVVVNETAGFERERLSLLSADAVGSARR